MNSRPKLYGYSEAANFLGISHQRFGRLVKKYEIPYQKISYGRIFFEADLLTFKNSQERKLNLKHKKK